MTLGKKRAVVRSTCQNPFCVLKRCHGQLVLTLMMSLSIQQESYPDLLDPEVEMGTYYSDYYHSIGCLQLIYIVRKKTGTNSIQVLVGLTLPEWANHKGLILPFLLGWLWLGFESCPHSWYHYILYLPLSTGPTWTAHNSMQYVGEYAIKMVITKWSHNSKP